MKKDEPEGNVKCPVCGRKKAVVKQDENEYRCTYCNILFDPRED